MIKLLALNKMSQNKIYQNKITPDTPRDQAIIAKKYAEQCIFMIQQLVKDGKDGPEILKNLADVKQLLADLFEYHPDLFL